MLCTLSLFCCHLFAAHEMWFMHMQRIYWSILNDLMLCQVVCFINLFLNVLFLVLS